MKPGDVFNPFKMFAGALIPESILASSDLPASAKTLYGQLKRYAGADGRCFPSQARLAADLGVSVRTIQRNLRTLREAGLVERTPRGFYHFLWNSLFESCENAGDDTTDLSCETRQNCRVYKRVNEENHIERTAPVVGVEMWKTRPVAAGDTTNQGSFDFGPITGTSAPTSTTSNESAQLGAVAASAVETECSIPPDGEPAEGLGMAELAQMVRDLAELKRMPAGKAVKDRTSQALARLDRPQTR